MTSSPVAKRTINNISSLSDKLCSEIGKIRACNEVISQIIYDSSIGKITPVKRKELIENYLGGLEQPDKFIAVSEKMGYRIRKNKDAQINGALAKIVKSLDLVYQGALADVCYEANNETSLPLLQKQLKYYELGLLLVSNILKKLNTSSAEIQQIISMTRAAEKAVARFSQMPKILIDSYDEADYLQVNSDVREDVEQGNIYSGMEHFLNFGLDEINRGLRKLRPDVGTQSISGQSRSVNPDSSTWAVCSEEDILAIRNSGIFDELWYIAQYGEAEDSISDYSIVGARQGKKPCYYFDAGWYLEKYPDVAESNLLPLLHYIKHGEQEGRWPCGIFDPTWYARKYHLKSYLGSLLAHYLNKGRLLNFNPNKVIDCRYYLQENTDVANTGADAAEHCSNMGWREGRNPSAVFDLTYYRNSHLNGDDSINPIVHYLTVGQEKNLPTNKRQGLSRESGDCGTPALGSVSDNTRYFANAGPGFKEPDSYTVDHIKPLAKTIAFYLPQFHAFPENDSWWGSGFTEWRNIMRGSPRFDGHYQPRIPRDLGFYDLNNESTLIAQAELAAKNGIEGFCFYYYWFNGKRLMNKPLDMYAQSSRIDRPFCIMWANENWTRTWDGFEKDVLIEQDYCIEDENAFIEDTANYFSNNQYIEVAGRPLFILYRPGLVPDGKRTFARWKRKWQQRIGVEPWIIMVQGFGDSDPREYGLDGAIEFPPHKVCANIPNINESLDILDSKFEGHAVLYDDVVKQSLNESECNYPLIKTVVPHWDNDARREGRGFVMHGSTPDKFGGWLSGAIEHAIERPFNNEPLVFINAWNEWAEGAYLEPDVHYGHAYLNATKRAVYGLESDYSKNKILLVGHDACPHGAQMLLLNIARTFKLQFGMEVLVILQKSGSLLEQYKQVARVEVLEQSSTDQIQKSLGLGQFKKAITNTSVTGKLVPILKGQGVKIVSLIHELPRLITEYGLSQSVTEIAQHANHIIFPSEVVQTGFLEIAGDAVGDTVVRPQGIYKNIEYDPSAKQRICEDLGIPLDSKLIINVGFADLRKGFDIFLNTAREMSAQNDHVHFIWVGGLAEDMKRWVYSDMPDESKGNNLHCVGYTDSVEDYFSACDCLFLTSREDPYPSVVLEAMSVGKPVVIFKDTTGLERVVCKYGAIVDRNNSRQIIQTLRDSINTVTETDRQARIEYVKNNCQFDDYCFSLLQLLQPEIKRVSVIVPNYNYEHYIESRLDSVFKQSYPIFEIIVLDDYSSDNSVEVINQFLDKTGRIVSFQQNKCNSGNTFKQWRKGLLQARGEFVWVAEADDLADSEFLSSSVASFSRDTVLSFCNSKQIDSYGETLSDSYDYYYKTISEKLFNGDFTLPGRTFTKTALSVKNPILNVSSVLWRKQQLLESLKTIGQEVVSYKLVGDWRLYIDVLESEDSTVSYLSSSLNSHRRHESSVTHSLDHQHHLEEIQSIHHYLNHSYKLSRAEKKAMAQYIEELVIQFGLHRAA